MKRTGFLRTRSPKTKPKDVFDSEPEVNTSPEHVKPVKVLRRGTYAGGTTGPAPKAPAPVRDEGYRRLVASLPCYHCGIEGFSQCAHPNSGKAKGRKASDAECFPMCCARPGVFGCHFLFDQHKLIEKEGRELYERRAADWTRKMLAPHLEQMGA